MAKIPENSRLMVERFVFVFEVSSLALILTSACSQSLWHVNESDFGSFPILIFRRNIGWLKSWSFYTFCQIFCKTQQKTPHPHMTAHPHLRKCLEAHFPKMPNRGKKTTTLDRFPRKIPRKCPTNLHHHIGLPILSVNIECPHKMLVRRITMV